VTRELLFSVTRKDLDETPIRGSGPGGQHRNKTSTGIRLKHRASGAVAEATDSKSQSTNRVNAFKRLLETPEFKRWYREAVHVAMGRKPLEQELAEAMSPENITTQVLDERSRWVTVPPESLEPARQEG
jgi:hypothetical protein